MKTEQEKIEEMAKVIQKIYITKISRNEHCLAQDIYKAGYRKASDVIDEFVERVKERALQSCHKIINCYEVTRIETVINDIAAEARLAELKGEKKNG